MQAILALARLRRERPRQHLIAMMSEHQMGVRGIQLPAFDHEWLACRRLGRRLEPARHDKFVEAGNDLSVIGGDPWGRDRRLYSHMGAINVHVVSRPEVPATSHRPLAVRLLRRSLPSNTFSRYGQR